MTIQAMAATATALAGGVMSSMDQAVPREPELDPGGEPKSAVSDDAAAASRISAGPLDYLKSINHVLALVEHKSYAEASRSLGLTQSALTQSILRLERQVGLKLFERGRFGATPTQAGLVLYNHSRRVAADTHGVFSELESIKNGSAGDVAIGIGKSMTWQIVPEAIRSFQSRHPFVCLRAYEGWTHDLFKRLMRGEFDFVVSASFPQQNLSPDLRQDALFSHKLLFVTSIDDPLARQQSVSLRELVDRHWVLPPPGTATGTYLHKLFLDAGLPPPRRFTRTDSIRLLLAMVEGGGAVGLTSSGLIAEGHTAGRVASLAVAELDAEIIACITYRRRRRLSPLAAELASEIRMATIAQKGILSQAPMQAPA
jgi:DNA-binding transcriptional LysR family regulator